MMPRFFTESKEEGKSSNEVVLVVVVVIAVVVIIVCVSIVVYVAVGGTRTTRGTGWCVRLTGYLFGFYYKLFN